MAITPITHASDKGYPLCGAKQRPCDPRADFSGDVVSGDLMRNLGAVVDCEACLRIEAAAARAAWAA
jgi:hypothetical protein